MNKQTPQQRQYERRKGQPKITGLYISHEEKALLDAAVAISGGIKAAIFDGLRLVVESQQKSASWISANTAEPVGNGWYWHTHIKNDGTFTQVMVGCYMKTFKTMSTGNFTHYMELAFPEPPPESAK